MPYVYLVLIYEHLMVASCVYLFIGIFLTHVNIIFNANFKSEYKIRVPRGMKNAADEESDAREFPISFIIC